MGHRVVETWKEGDVDSQNDSCNQQRYRELKRSIAEISEMKEKIEAERRSLRRVFNIDKRIIEQKSIRVEKETAMAPPVQSLSGQATNEEEEMSGDFEQLAKQEILKCRINSLKKQQVYSLLYSLSYISKNIKKN